MQTKANEVFAAHLRLGRFLPLPMVVLFSLLRGITFSVFGGLSTAPVWVVITRRSDGRPVARLSAGREPYVGETLLRSVQESMSELTPGDFLQHWHFDPS